MDLSNIKMVVTDMDGTLLNSNHEVSNTFFKIFEELKKRDILFIAASGRQYDSMAQKLAKIKDDIIIVAENGGYAKRQNEELFSTPLKEETKKKLLGQLGKIPNAFPILCSKTTAYLLNSQSEILTELQEYYTDHKIIDRLEDCKEDILKIAIFHKEGTEEHVYPYLKHLEGEIKVKVSGQFWLDLSDKDSHKGFAIEKLQKEYKIRKDETLVFGDYNNDLEMLGRATYSVAMENAHPNVIEAANYKTTSNDDFGVERILEKLIAAQPI